MGGRLSIAFIFVNKQNQQARKTYILVSLMFSIWRPMYGHHQTICCRFKKTAIHGLFLQDYLQKSRFLLLNIWQKINTQYLLSLFHHANCYSTFIFENKLQLVLCPHFLTLFGKKTPAVTVSPLISNQYFQVSMNFHCIS